MKLQWTALGLLLGAVADASKGSHLPSFATDSSGIRPPTSGRIEHSIEWQSPPVNAEPLDRHNWRVDCSSTHGESSSCSNTIDGWADTYWHSDCSSTAPVNTIIVDLGSNQNVSGLTMLPRMDEEVQRGQIAAHKVLLSTDTVQWDEVAYGVWGANKGMKLSVFDPKAARYVKLVAASEAVPRNDSGRVYEHLWTSIVDLNVYATNKTIPIVPGKGVWGPTLDLPVVPASAAQEKSGNIMLWSAWADDQFFASPGGQTFTTTWSALDKTIVQSTVSNTEHDMFCPGISMDFNGNIVVSGGADSGRTSIYNGTGWEDGPNMKIRRGYQASTTLSDGNIFVIGGSWSGGSKRPKNGELFDARKQEWKKLPHADVDVMLTNDKEGRWRADNHGWLFGWKANSVFQAGPSKAMNWFDINNGGKVTKAGNRLNDHHSMSGNAVMFDAVQGKIITFGGHQHYDGSPASKNAHLITLGAPYQKPKVEVAGTGSGNGMHFQRVFHTSVVLPDGTVFVTGGEKWGKPFLEEWDKIVVTPEIYVPDIDAFIPMQTNNVIRVYHSVSLLQPDGTIVNGGGGLCGNCRANHYDAQIFTPPYLFNEDGTRATQPKITEVTNTDNRVANGETIHFTTDEDIKDASLIRLGTTTHTVNTDQRRIPLTLRGAHTGYKTDVPADPGVALPGYYMLFVLNAKGVPSVAEIIKVELRDDATSSIEQSHGVVDEGEGENEEECDMEDKPDMEEIEGMIAVLAASTRKFWKTWRSALVTQG